MNKNISKKSWIVVLVLLLISTFSLRFDAKPEYLSLAFSMIGVFLIGLFSNKIIAFILSIPILPVGILLRKYIPDQSTSTKAEKIAEFTKKYDSFTSFLVNNMIYLIALMIVIAIVSGMIGEILQKDKSKKFTTNKIVFMAIFVTLGVIVNSMRVGAFSFGGFPIILSGLFLGPIPGFIVGGVTDLVAFLVRPSAFAFNPFYTLTSALTGLIPVVVVNLLKNEYPKYSFFKVLIGILVGQIITSVIMVPFFTAIVLGNGVFDILVLRAFIKQITQAPIYAFLSVTLIDRISRVINFEKAFK